MRLSSLTVENFRALTKVDLRDLSSAVVLAGPNGCGKSCVLDAIRILKSAYGSYVQDEWNMWFGEFQISLNRDAGELLSLLQDRAKPLKVTADFVLSASEREFLKGNLATLLEELFWRQLDPTKNRSAGQRSLAATQRGQQQQLEVQLAEWMPKVMTQLDAPSLCAALQIDPDGSTHVTESRLLELIFSTYLPQQLGVIDYHGPNRTYNRQRLNSVNLTIDASDNQQRQHALYNSANKYANLKTEMTSTYIRHLLAARADPTVVEDDLLTSTLKELFATFFPGKEFLGPQPTPDGRLTFLVRLSTGGEHDIDDLSSGEKEVVYGYLRLHSSAPHNSMIMIDEPELHLNPRLVSGLAAFYYRHLGARLGNQLWLVSHSDTLIREAVSHPAFSVFHVQPPHDLHGESQATAVKAKGDLEKVVLALVGDLAAYRPGAKVVVFESTADAAFDVRMTCTLFPDFEQSINSISAGNKRRVSDLYELLEQARAAGHIDARFFAISDADDDAPLSGPARRHQWDVYHIENYLLQPRFILDALRAVGVAGDVVQSEAAVLAALKSCAAETISELVAHKLRVHANRALISSIDLGFNPTRGDTAAALSEAIARSHTRMQECVAGELARSALMDSQKEHEVVCRAALADGSWLTKFRGRDVLRRFAGRHANGMQYEYLRELVINKMAEVGYQPIGMGRVLSAILKA
jgi:hypothetical protein